MTTRPTLARGGLVASLLLASFLLAGCGAPAGESPEETPAPGATEPSTESPAPEEPTAPTLETLRIGPDGLGPLLLGQAPEDDADAGVVHLDATACTDARTGFDLGIDEDSILAPLWVANDAFVVGGEAAFGVHVGPSGVVERIDLWNDEVSTETGTRVGDLASDALAAYPDAELLTGDLSDVIVVRGEVGILLIEIARERDIFDVPYWTPDRVDRVLAIIASLGDEPFSTAGSDNIAGGCPF